MVKDKIEEVKQTLWRYKTWVLNDNLEDNLAYERFNHEDAAKEICQLFEQALPALANDRPTHNPKMEADMRRIYPTISTTSDDGLLTITEAGLILEKYKGPKLTECLPQMIHDFLEAQQAKTRAEDWEYANNRGFIMEHKHQQEKEEFVGKVILWAEDHYWDSLQKHRDLIIAHIKESLAEFLKVKK